jgi:arylsulfatase A-like enzyme
MSILCFHWRPYAALLLPALLVLAGCGKSPAARAGGPAAASRSQAACPAPPRPVTRAGRRPSRAELTAAAKSANLVICVLDAARADRVGCYGYPRDTTPNLDQLAQESVVFRDHFATCPATLHSTGSLFTGLYPHTHRMGLLGAPARQPFTLAEGLQSAGWATAMFTANINASPGAGLGQGFAEASSGTPLTQQGTPVGLVRGFTDWLSAHKQKPFFVYLHFRPPHTPYDAPDRFRTEVVKRAAPATRRGHFEFPEVEKSDRRPFQYPPNEQTDLYDANMRWGDWGVGEVVKALRAQGLLDKTLLIVTADHGEAFGEHGYVYHLRGVYDELVHIPLVMRLPGRTRVTGDVTALSQTVDVPPTACELLGVRAPRVQGASLLPLLDGEKPRVRDHVFSVNVDGWPSYLIRDQRWSLLLYRGGKLKALYDLQADPGQQHNVIAAHPDVLAQLMKVFATFARTQARPLQEFVDPNAPAVPEPKARRTLTPEARRQLKTLGYVE